MKYAITVDFRLNPGCAAEFLPLIDKNAALSLRDEPGCERFDVLTVDSDADHVLLYEVYADRQAFAAHCETAHFLEFDQVTRALVRDKQVVEFALRAPWRG